MRRVTVAEIMRETGLSRATVDRVLNGRGHVHDRTRAVVEDAFRRLSMPEVSAPAGPPVADIALRVGKGMMAQMRAAFWPSSRETSAPSFPATAILPSTKGTWPETKMRLPLLTKPS